MSKHDSFAAPESHGATAAVLTAVIYWLGLTGIVLGLAFYHSGQDYCSQGIGCDPLPAHMNSRNKLHDANINSPPVLTDSEVGPLGPDRSSL